MAPRIDRVGQTFGRLTVVKLDGKRKGNFYWFCDCSCGQRISVCAGNLTSKQTTSCGCFQVETMKRLLTTHGEGAASPEYRAWRSMISRCYNPKVKSYDYYGGRGVIVCDRWRHSYVNFLCDMGRKPGKEYSLDKDILVEGNKVYGPGLCCWATRKQQATARRNSKKLSYKGKTKNLSEWADELGIGRSTVAFRVKAGWPSNRALETPTQEYHKRRL